MRICQKNNCSYEAIPRGKFCEIHRSVKRTRDIEIENQKKLEKDIERQSILEQERKLKSEQDI